MKPRTVPTKMAALMEGALDAYWRWFWYPLTEVVGTVTGLHRIERWYRARTRARREMRRGPSSSTCTVSVSVTQRIG